MISVHPMYNASWRRVLLTGVAVLSLAFYAVRIVGPSPNTRLWDFAAYYTGAHLLMHTPGEMAHIYDDLWFRAQIERAGLPGVRSVFDIQPPTMSLLMAPVAWMPPLLAFAVWRAVETLCLCGGLIVLGKCLGLRLRRALWLIPLGLLYSPVRLDIRLGQAYLTLFFVLTLLFSAASRTTAERQGGLFAGLRTGLPLGLMLVIKSAAVWLWPLLLLGGRWRAILWGILVAAAVAVVTLPIIGVQTWRAYFEAIPPFLGAAMHHLVVFQTTTSFFGRLFMYDAEWNPEPLANCPWLAHILTLGISLAALILTARWARLNDERVAARMLTLALYISLIVVNAPVATEHHYNLVLPALIVAWWWAGEWRPGWRSYTVLIAATFLLGFSFPYLEHRLENGAWVLLAYPRVCGAYLLWGWLGAALCSMPAAPATESRRFAAVHNAVHADALAEPRDHNALKNHGAG